MFVIIADLSVLLSVLELFHNKIDAIIYVYPIYQPLRPGKDRSFQFNGHFWKKSTLFLMPLGPFLGMHCSNFLKGASGNFRTFWT